MSSPAISKSQNKMKNKKRQAKGAKSNDSWAIKPSPALEAALYYGFTPSQEIPITKLDKDQAKSLNSDHNRHNDFDVEEKIAIIRHHFSKGIPPLPLMLFSEITTHGKKDPKVNLYRLDIIGTTRSIADATVLKAAYEISNNGEYNEMLVEINSVGDRDSFNRYSRELGSYFRKHINDLHPDCRQRLKKSPFSVIAQCNHEKCRPVLEQAPKSMGFLSEPSRLYFMEVLELLEMTGIPYTINNNLISSIECGSHIIFKIYGKKQDSQDLHLVASGCRWSGIAKKMGFKKDIPGVSATITVKKQPKTDSKKRTIGKPKFYFIQMGQEAKLKSLILIETLRRARIPVYHSLTKDKLTAQLSSAEHLKVPYILIMGQKESMENTVLVREMTSMSQDTIRIAEMAEYLKKLL
jgi:histidyl-tRNA synthetase